MLYLSVPRLSNEELHPTKKHGILRASLLDKDRFSCDKEGSAFVYLFVVHLA